MSKKIHAGDLVIQSNNLVEAFYDSDLSVTEHKILRYAITKASQNASDFPHVTFGVKEFLDAAGLKGNNYHSQIEKIGDELTRKRIKVKNNNNVDWFPWLSALRYRDGVIYLVFNTLLSELVLELEGQFMKYSFQYIGDMKSSYSIRLLEILKQYAPIGKRRIEVETLKQMLGVADKYAGYGQFKQRVLEQAKKELDKKGGLTFHFEEIKQGRKVVELVFFIKLVDGKILPKDLMVSAEPQGPFVKEAKLLLASYDISIPEEKVSTWRDYGIPLLHEVLKDVKSQDMKYPYAYISKVLKNKYEERLQMKKMLDYDNEQDSELILSFIYENIDLKSPVMDWFTEQKFETFLKKSHSPTEIKELWENNREFILDKLKGN